MEVYFPWYQGKGCCDKLCKIKNDELMMQLVKEIKEFQWQNECSFCICHYVSAKYCLAGNHKCRCYGAICPDDYTKECNRFYCRAEEHQCSVPSFDDDHGLLSLIAKFQKKEQKCVCLLVSQPQFCSLSDEKEHQCRCTHLYDVVMPLKFCRAKMHNCLCDDGLNSTIAIKDCPASKHKCCCRKNFFDKCGHHVCRAQEHLCMCTMCVHAKDGTHPNKCYYQIRCRCNGEHECICSYFCRNNYLVGSCQARFHNCICQSRYIKLDGYQCLSSGEHPCICLDNYFKKPTVWRKRPCRHLIHECICEKQFQEKCQAEYHICQCNKKAYRCYIERPCSKKGFQVLEHKCYCGQRVSCFAKKHRCTCDLEKEIRLVMRQKEIPKHVTVDVIKHIRKKKLDYRCMVKFEMMKAFSESIGHKLPDEIVEIIFSYSFCPESTP